MTKEDEHQVTKAGITTNADGSRHIPSSIRADGSVRKEIKIRPGYRPPEDIEKYKNRTAEAFRNKGKNGVPGAETVDGSPLHHESAAANKNARRREARKKMAAAKKVEEARGADSATNGPAKSEQLLEEIDRNVAKQREVKKLVKKLRQAKELKDKKESGAALLPEQIEKVIKISELIRQLDNLGFDAEGAEKDGEAEDEISTLEAVGTTSVDVT